MKKVLTDEIERCKIESTIRVYPALRSQQMIEWIRVNAEKLDSYSNGNLQFSFTGDTLKVKDENYEKIM